MPMRAVPVTTAGTLELPYNPARKSAAIINNGTETVFFSNDKPADTSQGIFLATGQSMVLKDIEGDEPWFQLWGISPTTTNDIRVFEGFGQLPA